MVMRTRRWMMRERESLDVIWRFYGRGGVDARGIRTKHAFSMGGISSAFGSYKSFSELRSTINLMPS